MPVDAVFVAPPPDFFFELESLLPDALSPDPLSPEPDDPSADPLDPSPDPESVAAAALVFEPDELDRSFLAQPEPLKCTAGGTKTLRSVSSAPQAGQNRGAGASMPWMNSVRVLQLEQT